MDRLSHSLREQHRIAREDFDKDHSRRICKLIEQTNPNRDVLLTDYHCDIAAFALAKLNKLGLSLTHLIHLQIELPLVYPWDANSYNTLRLDVNKRVNCFPLIIVMAKHTRQVSLALTTAIRYKIPFTLRSGGHDFEAFSINDGLIIDQSRRTGIKYGNCHTACSEDCTVLSGSLLGPLALKLSNKGLVFPSGTCANNGTVMYVCGGGIGLLSRKFGLACDSLIEAEIVLANGQIVTASANKNIDLFWACKGGGGGNFGIVTKLRLRTYKVDRVVMFNLTWKTNKIEQVLAIWQRWITTTSNNIGSHYRILGGTDANSKVTVYGIYLGCESKARKHLSCFIDIEGIECKIEETDYINTVRQFTGMARWLPFFKAKNTFLYKLLPKDALCLIGNVMRHTDSNNVFALESLGGAVKDILPTETAFPHRGAWTWLLINSHWSMESETKQRMSWITKFYEQLEQYAEKRVYVNAKDNDLVDYLYQYYRENLDRLRCIKKKYDPNNVFNFRQSIRQ